MAVALSLADGVGVGAGDGGEVSQAKGFADAECGVGVVEGIKVDAGGGIVDEIADLFGGPVDADVFDVLVALSALDCAEESGGETGASSEGGHAVHACEGGNGHDAGDDGDVDAGEFAPLGEVVEVSVVEEHLGDDVVGAGVDLGFKAFDFGEAVGGVGVAFGVAGDTDVQMGEALADETDELGGVSEVGATGIDFGVVSAEGEDVSDAELGVALEDVVDFGVGGADAGEVGGDGEVGFGFESGDKVVGALSGGTAGTVGNGDEGGVEGHETSDVAEEFFRASLGFGGEELEADGGPLGLEDVSDSHGSSHGFT